MKVQSVPPSTAAAVPRSAPPAPAPTANTVLPQDLNRLRKLRAEAQGLQEILDKVRTGEMAIASFAEYIKKTLDDMRSLIDSIGDENDTIRSIHNIWEQMSVNPLLRDPAAATAAQDQLHHLSALDQQIRKLVFHLGFLTIPARLSEWLAQARPGYYIPFHLVFEDEMPNPEDRTRLLNYLAWSPEGVKGGIVDAASGLIYRYSEKASARWISVALLFFGLLAATGVVAVSCLFPLFGSEITRANLPAFLAGWGAILAGIVTHAGIASVKRAQARGGLPPVIAVGDLTYIIDAWLGQLGLRLLLALIGFFGLVFAAGVAEVTVLNTFLVGYSLDSFVELFGASLEQRATAQVSALKQRLGVP
jgi:hypothetical protein